VINTVAFASATASISRDFQYAMVVADNVLYAEPQVERASGSCSLNHFLLIEPPLTATRSSFVDQRLGQEIEAAEADGFDRRHRAVAEIITTTVAGFFR
jgi:hypothetical protein